MPNKKREELRDEPRKKVKKAYYKVKGLEFEVIILKEEMKFGRKHYTIKPVAGKGEFTTWKLKIK